MTTYSIIPMTTNDRVVYCIQESCDDGEQRFVSEHATEADAEEYLNELQKRENYWRA